MVGKGRENRGGRKERVAEQEGHGGDMVGFRGAVGREGRKMKKGRGRRRKIWLYLTIHHSIAVPYI